MKKFTVAVVGLGYWGPNLVRNFYESENYIVKWGCDLVQENLHKIKKTLPSIQTTNDFKKILDDPEVDLVVIATTPETHAKLGEMALKASKHLWIEKPFTTSLKSAQKLFALAKKRGLYLHVDLPFIFYGPVLRIKEFLDTGMLGEPNYFTSTRTNLGLIQKDVDVIWDLAPHDLSILFFLYPHLKVKSISAQGSSPIGTGKKLQIANLVIEFNDNFMAYIHLSWLSPVKLRLITLGGRKRMILFDDINPTEKVKLYDKSVEIAKSDITPYNPVYRSGDVLIPIFSQKEALQEQVKFLYDKLATKSSDYFTVNIALRILKVLEDIRAHEKKS